MLVRRKMGEERRKGRKVPLCQKLCHLLSNVTEQSEILLVLERILHVSNVLQPGERKNEREKEGS